MSDASNTPPGQDQFGSPQGQEKVAARILRRWRQLSGGKQVRDHERRTLIACSGGADSVCLVRALAKYPSSCIVAYIQHDIRAVDVTSEEVDFVAELAHRLEMGFETMQIAVTGFDGNLEANARRLRYESLKQIAKKNNCRYIATGHHADDQLETLLMNLIRGSGPSGMAAMAESRPLSADIDLIRPLLGISREQIEIYLKNLNQPWCQDQTNEDQEYLRNRIRHSVIPELRAIEPDISLRAVSWTQDINGFQNLLTRDVEELFDRGTLNGQTWSLSRAQLRVAEPVVLGSLLHFYFRTIHGPENADSITRRSIESWVQAVKSQSTDPSEHRVGPIVSHITSKTVSLDRAGLSGEREVS